MKYPIFVLTATFYAFQLSAAAAKVDTSAITNATTTEEAISAYKSAVEGLVADNKDKIDDKELTSAQSKMTENIDAVNAAAQDGTLSETINDADAPDGDTKDDKTDKGATTPKLSKEESAKNVEELRENAQAMKDKEQSTANKLIGAAGIGATGIGAMQAASAMAEQNADEDAEQAMKAYLETFHCNYGGGINIKGGETEIELPGGNDLVSLYTEYAMLANDLKIRKEALGLKAGIESEVLIDKATSGLYDDVSLGKTGGAYASIARALMDETSADAEAWAAQKSETASKLKTGMITAGVGAAGSLIANLAVNSGDKNKNKVDQINNKYADKVKIFEEDIAKLPDKTANAKCVSGSTGTFPNCTCTQNTQIYNSNTNTCDACPGEKSVKTGTNVCDCPDGTVPTENDKCTTSPVQTKCDTTDPNIIVDEKTGECSCQNDYTIDSTGIKCECKAPKSVQDGKCVSKIELTPILSGKLPDLSTPISLDMSQLKIPTLTGTQQQTIIEINLTSDNLFALGSSDLSNDAKQTIANNINQLTTQMQTENISADDICIKITGHTDKSGGDSVNQPLSEKRAKAVKDYIVSINNSLITSTNTVVEGRGSQECATANSRGYSKECRHVTITASNGKCSS